MQLPLQRRPVPSPARPALLGLEHDSAAQLGQGPAASLAFLWSPQAMAAVCPFLPCLESQGKGVGQSLIFITAPEPVRPAAAPAVPSLPPRLALAR